MSVVMYCKRNFYLSPAINEKIANLQSGGLIDYWHYTFLKRENKRKQSGPTPSKLNVAHLEGTFEIWFSGCVIAVVTFVVEITCKKSGSKLNFQAENVY